LQQKDKLYQREFDEQKTFIFDEQKPFIFDEQKAFAELFIGAA